MAEEQVLQTLFSSMYKCRYLVSEGCPEKYTFSGMAASIANRCAVEVLRDIKGPHGESFAVLSACWSKPHYFVINKTTNDVTWVRGDLRAPFVDWFEKLYTTVTSLSHWVSIIRDLALDKLLVAWVNNGHFLSIKAARKNLCTRPL
jgi:hypothetical protein